MGEGSQMEEQLGDNKELCYMLISGMMVVDMAKCRVRWKEPRLENHRGR